MKFTFLETTKYVFYSEEFIKYATFNINLHIRDVLSLIFLTYCQIYHDCNNTKWNQNQQTWQITFFTTVGKKLLIMYKTLASFLYFTLIT